MTDAAQTGTGVRNAANAGVPHGGAGAAGPADAAPPSTAGPPDPGALEAGLDLPSFTESLVRMSLTLGVMLLVLLGIALLVRRMHRRGLAGRGGRRLEVLEVCPLGPRKSVCLVRIGRAQAVLGVTPERIETIVAPSPEAAGLIGDGGDDVAGAPARDPGFDAALARRTSPPRRPSGGAAAPEEEA